MTVGIFESIYKQKKQYTFPTLSGIMHTEAMGFHRLNKKWTISSAWSLSCDDGECAALYGLYFRMLL